MPKEVKDLETRIEELEADLARLAREKSEQDAQLSLYRKAVESGRDGIALFDRNLSLVFCNQNYRNIFHEFSDILKPGMNIRELSHKVAASGLIIDAVDDMESWVAQRTNINQRLFDEAYFVELSNGTWLRATDYRTEDGGFLAVRTDVTEMKRREAELEADSEETRRVLQAFFEHSPVPMIIKDTNRIYRELNGAFEQLHGVKTEDVVGKPMEEALPGLATALGRSADHVILEGAGPISREHTVVRDDGSESTVTTSKFPILDADGNITAIGAISVDISRFIDIQEKLAAKSELLETTLRSIDQGFVVFDKDMRILACNQRFFELHNYPTTATVEGLPLREMLNHFASAGAFGDTDPEEKLDKRYRQLASDDRPEREVRTQSDGKILDVRRTNLASGGYVASFTDITDLKRAEKRAEDAHQLLREILDTLISSVCLYDKDQRLVYSNKATENLFGWQADLFRPGIAFEEQIRNALAKNMIRGVGDAPDEWILQRLSDFTNRRLNVVTEITDNRWIISDFREMSDGGTVAVHRDITNQTRAEKALRESEENFRSLVENTEIGISISVRRNLLFVNDAFSRIFGYDDRDDVYRQGHYDKFIAPGDLDRVRAISDARTENRPAPSVYEFEGLRKDGTTRMIRRTSRMVTWNGVRATLGTVEDVTQRHQSEERLRAALDAAETANRTKSDFLAKMSHELRTPLNAIIGFSEVLGRETFGPLGNPRYESYVNDIALSGRHLLEMINDILDMSKIEAGGYEIEPVEADVMPAINDTLQVVRGQLEQRGIDLQLNTGSDIPLLYADKRAIRQILLNLLSNAIKFTPEGGRIAIAAHRSNGGGMTITITDSGIGISSEDLDSVFKPFNQGSNPHSTVQPGTGLGLPIVKSLTEMHGGKLSISSEVGIGTTVRLTFPGPVARSDGQASAAGD